MNWLVVTEINKAGYSGARSHAQVSLQSNRGADIACDGHVQHLFDHDASDRLLHPNLIVGRVGDDRVECRQIGWDNRMLNLDRHLYMERGDEVLKSESNWECG